MLVESMKMPAPSALLPLVTLPQTFEFFISRFGAPLDMKMPPPQPTAVLSETSLLVR